jgi:hypothetical protein
VKAIALALTCLTLGCSTEVGEDEKQPLTKGSELSPRLGELKQDGFREVRTIGGLPPECLNSPVPKDIACDAFLYPRHIILEAVRDFRTIRYWCRENDEPKNDWLCVNEETIRTPG